MNAATLLGQVGKFNVLARSDCFTSHAGLLLVKEFADRLGLADLLNHELKVKKRRRSYSEAEAVLALVYNSIVGGDCLADLEVLRGDPGTKELLAMAEMLAPTTAGEHLVTVNLRQPQLPFLAFGFNCQRSFISGSSSLLVQQASA